MQLLPAARTELHHQTPLVQCLTNTVSMEISCNVLLAAGAQPAMCDTPEESFEFAQIASGVLVNLGTPTQSQYAGIREAVRGAAEAGTPWVLDPVAVGVGRHRSDFIRSLLVDEPTVIRGNASEIKALAGEEGISHGSHSLCAVEDAVEAAKQIADQTGAVVAVSGSRDLIVSEGRTTWLSSDDPMLQKVIGTGCAVGALCAAYVGASRGAYLTSEVGGEISDHSAILAAHAHAGAAAQ